MYRLIETIYQVEEMAVKVVPSYRGSLDVDHNYQVISGRKIDAPLSNVGGTAANASHDRKAISETLTVE